MGNVILTTVGTIGDLVPFLRLGRDLKSRGHKVCLITHCSYRELVERADLDFTAIDTAAEAAQLFKDDSVWNSPHELPTLFRRHFLPKVLLEYELMADKWKSNETVIIARSSPGLAALMISEKLGVPVVPLFTTPIQLNGMLILDELFRTVLAGELNQIRQQLSLFPISDWGAYIRSPSRSIAAWPDWFCPAEIGWPSGVETVGFLLDDESQKGVIPESVEKMLGLKQAPILFSGGSNPALRAEFHKVCVEACQKIGRPGILVTRNLNSVPMPLPPEVVSVEQLPFASLLPRLGAVVHHGGMGTLGRAIAAGIPQLVLGFGADRPDNGLRLRKLGIAEYLPPTSWRPEIVAGALEYVLRSTEMKGCCQDFAGKFRLDNSSLKACELVEQLLKEGGNPVRAAQSSPAIQNNSNNPRKDPNEVLKRETYGKILENLSPERRALLELHLKESSRPDDSKKTIPVSPRKNGYNQFPLSYAQERLWFLDQLEPGNVTYNGVSGVRLKGLLDFAALEKTLNGIVSRHEILRTIFETELGTPVQSIAPELIVTIPLVDLECLAGSVRQLELHRIASDEARRPFDLGKAPLFRTMLIRFDGMEHLMLYNIHHIVSDGWSWGVLIRDFAKLYEAISAGRPSPLTELRIQYADFAQWQREWLQGEVLQKQLDYWRNQLGDDLLALELPLDKTRPLTPTFHGAKQFLALDKSLTEDLNLLSRQEGVTHFMLLLAAFKVMLYRHTGQEDLVVGTSIANRNKSEVENLIGFFVNALVLYTNMSGDPCVRELLQRVRRVALGAYANQDLPFEQLVHELQPNRDLSHSPLFKIVFVLQNAPSTTFHLPNLEVESVEFETETSKFDLTLSLSECESGLAGYVEYNTDLFERATILRTIEHWKQLLREFVRNVDRRISDLTMMTVAEREIILEEWNQTAVKTLADKCLHELFEEQVERDPEAVAVVFGEQEWSYGELNRRANVMAEYLRGLGVGPEVAVGIYVERSLEMMAGILGIMKAGGAYVPLDTSYPKERLQFMLEDAGAMVLVTQRAIADRLPTHSGIMVNIDEVEEQNGLRGDENVISGVSPENLAYIIYTSGSTGQPKGVMIRHEGLTNYAKWSAVKYGLKHGNGSIVHSSIAFDLTITGLLVPLVAGQRVRLVAPGGGVEVLEEAITDGSDYSLVKITPAHLEVFKGMISPESARGWARMFVIGGEALAGESLRYWQAHAPGTRLINEYGPTETVVGCCVYEVQEQSSGRVPIGRPIANTQIYILDQSLELQPVGVKGELSIGGHGLGRGYMNRPELTAENFIPDGYGKKNGGRLYRTGDLGRHLASGDIEYLGRRDDQVKVRGYRIELGEVEKVLAQHAMVKESVAVVREDEVGDRRLVGYVMPVGMEQSREYKEEQVAEWRRVFDEHLYELEAGVADPTFNTVGWDSSYTGEAIPVHEMREWLEDTLEGIKALKPGRVLEIGCGSGIILFGLREEYEEYWGTDFSEKALGYIEQQIAEAGMERERVKLQKREADDFEGLDGEKFDVVVLNSVVQYFPNIEYLVEVLEGVVKLVREGGFIFLGDVRSFPLEEAFAVTVQAARAGEGMTIRQLEERVRMQRAQEKELVIDPGFFMAFKEHVKEIGELKILPKKGRARNELMLYRYQVIMQVGKESRVGAIEQWLDWERHGLSLASVRQRLEDGNEKSLGIRNVANIRLAEALEAVKMLKNPNGVDTVGELRRMVEGRQYEGVELHSWDGLSEELGYEVEVSWARHGADGRYDVIFWKGERRGFEVQPTRIKPWKEYTNDPLYGKMTRQLVPQLKIYLEEKVPKYMVPSAIVVLEKLPLTSNGKVDRRALPMPEPERWETGVEYVGPRNEAEQKLADIWSEVLRLKRIGVNDNFFGLGGDSILSIQIVSRANQAGLRLTPRQLFTNQTIAQLATVAGVDELSETEQGIASPTVELTPIQRWFFEQETVDRNHFNQAVMLQINAGMESEWAGRVICQLVMRHDALRLRFESQNGTCDRVVIAAQEDNQIFGRIDLSALAPAEQGAAISAATDKAQLSLNLRTGPLLRAIWFDLGPANEARLLVVIHHLATDALSWRVLLEDVQKGCLSLKENGAIDFGRKTTSYQKWAERLATHANSEIIGAESTYWRELLKKVASPLPVDVVGGDNLVASEKSISVWLTEAETKALLQEVPEKYHTQINDPLLTALGWALGRWTGTDSVLLDLEGHGREDIFDGVNLTRTVGWFTTLYPVRLEIDPTQKMGSILKSVKEQLRAIPNRGIGYGLLRYLRADTCASLQAVSGAQVSFNYLGQFDQVREGAWFKIAQESTRAKQSSRRKRSYLLEVSGSVVGERLGVHWVYSETVHSRETIDGVARDFIDALRDLISDSQSGEIQEFTPADFPLAHVTQSELDWINQSRQIEDLYALSSMQEAMLFQSLYEPKAGYYFEQLSCSFQGTIRIDAFKQAWQAVIRAHAVLRTGFLWEGLDQPCQVVHKQLDLFWDERDWRGISSEEQAQRVKAYLDEDRQKGFDFSRPPLMRFGLCQLGKDAYQFTWSHHHILLDGWSLYLVLKDVFSCYEKLCRGEEMQWLPAHQFRDYIAWLQMQDLSKAERFWREYLEGFEGPTTLEIERTEARESSEPEEQEWRLSEELTVQLKSFCRRYRLTLNTLVQGAWALILNQYGGKEDVVFGTIVSGRPPQLPGAEKIIGLFINSLPVRIRVDQNASILDWLKGIQAQQVSMREFEYSPLEEVQGWSAVPRGTPLFDTFLLFENYPLEQSLQRWAKNLRIQNARTVGRQFNNLTIMVNTGSRMNLKILYDNGRFELENIRRLFGHMEALFQGMLSEAQRISELRMLTPEECELILDTWNGTSQDHGEIRCVHELFESQARRCPGSVALADGTKQMSYQELNQKANQLGHYLKGLGVGPEVRVGICLNRSVEMVVALLGVLKAGGVYVPLDSEYPKERLKFMMEDSQADVLITEERLRVRLELGGTNVICLDREWPAISGEKTTDLAGRVTPDNALYLLYTSGSTGRPKGILMNHFALHNLIKWHFDTLPSGVHTLQFASLSFDASFHEIFAALASGGKLLIASETLRLDIESLVRYIASERIEKVILPVVVFQQIALDYGDRLELFESLREITTTGEQLILSPAICRLCRELSTCRLHNHYGPSETHVVTAYTFDEPPESLPPPPIGRPIANTQIYILNKDLVPVPIGVSGELFVGGVSLARGYHNRFDETANKFVPNPFATVPGERLYRTGDLARHRSDGNIEFLGRLDHQVKIRGFRVEPGEIESVLINYPGVRECVVLTQESEARGKLLVAYVGSGHEAPSKTRLRQFLETKLPDYMIPSEFIFLKQLPLTPNGKGDRKALQNTRAAESGNEHVEPRTSVEQELVEIWRKVLKVEKIGVHDDFFALGGHSLLAARVISQVRDAFQIELPLKTFFGRGFTVERLAKSVIEYQLGSLEQSQRAGMLDELDILSDREAGSRFQIEAAPEERKMP